MARDVPSIADYAHALGFSDLSPAAVHQCTRSLIDTVGVALGAFDAEPCRIARALAQRASATPGARIMGTTHRTLPELAAFANGVMARFSDGNDVFPGGGGHPSDMIPAVLAAADTNGADGRTVITAIALAYEIYHALWTATNMRDKGMDNVFYTAVGGAVGAAKVLGLDRARIAETIALAVTPNIALDATRHGRLSMWKGCAGGNAARNGVFAALLAQAGMTGPPEVLAGEHALDNLVGKFELPALAGSGGDFRIAGVTLKFFLSEGHSLSPITAALELCGQVAVEDIETVRVHTYRWAWNVIGRGREKWRPAPREDADHSMPYVVAATLLDRGFSDAVFDLPRLQDPRLLKLIDRVEVVEDPALTRQFPEKLPCRIEITTRSGATRVAEVEYPRGHHHNPMSDDEVSAKFRDLAQRKLSPERAGRALDAMWRLSGAPGLDAIFDSVRIGD